MVYIKFYRIANYDLMNVICMIYCNRSKDKASNQRSEHHDQVTKLAPTLDEHEEEMTTFGYAVVDTKKVYTILLHIRMHLASL